MSTNNENEESVDPSMKKQSGAAAARRGKFKRSNAKEDLEWMKGWWMSDTLKVLSIYCIILK